MKLYKISQDVRDDYDTYSDAVVCAENEDDAKTICPDSYLQYENGVCYDIEDPNQKYISSAWAPNIKDVKVEYLGEAHNKLKRGLIISSFHAG
jgi:hypothetical protein